MKSILKLALLVVGLQFVLKDKVATGVANLELRKEAGDVPGWVLVTIAVIVIAGIAAAAITAFINSKVAEIK